MKLKRKLKRKLPKQLLRLFNSIIRPLSQPHVIGFPAVSDIQSCAVNSDPNLAKKHNLWTRVTSGGLSLPFPIDSCCSISLVSGAHTDHLLKTSKNLTYIPLQTPIPVSVAGPTATLKATGTMEVPITFENNTNCTFLMLWVPGLAWPFLHQQSTEAIVDHHALTITFRHPQLNRTINCQPGNPVQAFPSLIPDQNSQTAAPVTCLLTGLPTPTQLYRRIPLHFVTVCLLLTTRLVGSNLFHSFHFYSQGNQLAEDLHVLSGPTSLSSIPSVPVCAVPA